MLIHPQDLDFHRSVVMDNFEKKQFEFIIASQIVKDRRFRISSFLSNFTVYRKKNKFRIIAGEDQLIDKEEFFKGLDISNQQLSDRLFNIFPS